MAKPTVNVLGAGIIGLSCALALKSRGATVRIFDPRKPGRGASWAAAGMLSPAFEAADAEISDTYFDLCLRSKAGWLHYVRALANTSGASLGFQSGGSLAVATSEAETNALARLAARLNAADVRNEPVSEQAARNLEPTLSPNVLSAMSLPDDGWVNNRAVIEALARMLMSDLRPYLAHEERPAADFELHAGWSPSPKSDATLTESTLALRDRDLALRAVAGRMHVYERDSLPVGRVIRCGEEYAVPRGDSVLFGATVGEVDDPDSVLEQARDRFLSSRRGIERTAYWDSHRPRFRDQRLRIGPVNDRQFIAMGHYRNGILLAPITAQIIAEQIMDGRTPGFATPFLP